LSQECATISTHFRTPRSTRVLNQAELINTANIMRHGRRKVEWKDFILIPLVFVVEISVRVGCDDVRILLHVPMTMKAATVEKCERGLYVSNDENGTYYSTEDVGTLRATAQPALCSNQHSVGRVGAGSIQSEPTRVETCTSSSIPWQTTGSGVWAKAKCSGSGPGNEG
jgi:hypothetical protein